MVERRLGVWRRLWAAALHLLVLAQLAASIRLPLQITDLTTSTNSDTSLATSTNSDTGSLFPANSDTTADTHNVVGMGDQPTRTIYFVPSGLASNCEFTIDKARYFARALRATTLMLPPCRLEFWEEGFRNRFSVTEFFESGTYQRCRRTDDPWQVQTWAPELEEREPGTAPAVSAVCVSVTKDGCKLLHELNDHQFGEYVGYFHIEAVYDSMEDLPADYSGNIYLSSMFEACVPCRSVMQGIPTFPAPLSKQQKHACTTNFEAQDYCLRWFWACDFPVFQDRLVGQARDVLAHDLGLRRSRFACIHWRQGDFALGDHISAVNFVRNIAHVVTVTGPHLQERNLSDIVLITNDDTPEEKIHRFSALFAGDGITVRVMSEALAGRSAAERVYLNKVGCAMADEFFGTAGSSFSGSIAHMRSNYCGHSSEAGNRACNLQLGEDPINYMCGNECLIDNSSKALPSPDEGVSPRTHSDTSRATPTNSDTGRATPINSDTAPIPSASSDTGRTTPTNSDTAPIPPPSSDTGRTTPTNSDTAPIPPPSSDTGRATSTNSDTAPIPSASSDTSVVPSRVSDTSSLAPTNSGTAVAAHDVVGRGEQPTRTLYFVPEGLASNCEFTIDKARYFARALGATTLMLPPCRLEFEHGLDTRFSVTEFFDADTYRHCRHEDEPWQVQTWAPELEKREAGTAAPVSAVCVSVTKDGCKDLRELNDSGMGEYVGYFHFEAVYDSIEALPQDYSGSIFVSRMFEACVPCRSVMQGLPTFPAALSEEQMRSCAKNFDLQDYCMKWFRACDFPVFQDRLIGRTRDILAHDLGLRRSRFACIHWRQGDFTQKKSSVSAEFVLNVTHVVSVTVPHLQERNLKDIVLITNDDTPQDRIHKFSAAFADEGMTVRVMSEALAGYAPADRIYFNKVGCAMADEFFGTKGSSFSGSIEDMRNHYCGHLSGHTCNLAALGKHPISYRCANTCEVAI